MSKEKETSKNGGKRKQSEVELVETKEEDVKLMLHARRCHEKRRLLMRQIGFAERELRFAKDAIDSCENKSLFSAIKGLNNAVDGVEFAIDEVNRLRDDEDFASQEHGDDEKQKVKE